MVSFMYVCPSQVLIGANNYYMFVCLPLQGFVELAALEDILEPYLDSESRENFENSKKHLGSWDIRGNER